MTIITDPNEIEKRSFEIITERLEGRDFGPNAPVVKRVIHTTADFDYIDNLVFSENVFEKTISLLKKGGFHVVTDTRMAEAGVNKRSLAALGGSIHCFIDSVETLRGAKVTGTTRSAAAVDVAVSRVPSPLLFLVGNAPTALIRLHELVLAQRCKPELIVGVPVGFVNVVESKEMILSLDLPMIVARGRKGGSTVAAAVFNALMYEAGGR